MFITMWILEFVFNQEFLTASSVFLGYSTGLYCLWNYCIQNNINHFSENEKNAKQVIEKREDCINQVKNLKVWLSMQNIYAVLLALPYSLFFIVIKWTMSDNEKLLP